MRKTSEVYQRYVLQSVKEALEDTRVVVINGARQVGKSTLTNMVLDQLNLKDNIRYLDDATTRENAIADPTSFVKSEELLAIDEIQRVPELLLSMKNVVDRNTRPGQFLLTGSARILGLQSIPDSLIGRSETVTLWPLSQGEIEGKKDSFVCRVFSSKPVWISSTLTKSDYIARALRGGYPEAVARQDLGRRARFFQRYLDDLIERDIKQITEIEKGTQLKRLLGILAAGTSGLLVPERISSDVGIPVTTLRRYLNLLELVYVIHRIPYWSNNLTTRAVGTPKFIFVDSGIAGHLMKLTPARCDQLTSPTGQLMENFVVGELLRQISWSGEHIELSHYRDRDKREVDVVLEDSSGQIAGVEVKASATIRGDDFNHLRFLESKTAHSFVGGYVLYSGETCHQFGEKLWAVPMENLWASS